VHRSRHALNGDTIREMHLAFRRGGRKAIDKVMKTQPAVFLKLLVLLVPREIQVEHRGGVKAMSDGQLEAAIEAITAMLAARDQSAGAGADAKVIEEGCPRCPMRGRRASRAEQRFGKKAVVDLTGISGYYTFLAMQLDMARYEFSGAGPRLSRFPN
jgi:hypothetical protein